MAPLLYRFTLLKKGPLQKAKKSKPSSDMDRVKTTYHVHYETTVDLCGTGF